MFSQAPVILFTGEGWRGRCMAGGRAGVPEGGICAGGMHGGGGWGGMCGGGHALWGVGVCVAGEACMAGETATAADGTHPTGMHSCYQLIM